MRSAVTSLVCLLALTGCGGSSDDDDKDDAAPDSCSVLSEAQVADLAGQPVTQSRDDEVGGVPACRYMVENGDQVQVIDVPASQWSRELPALLDQVEQSGLVNDPKSRAKFADAREQLDAAGFLDDDAACALFSDLLEIQGLPAGEERIVNLVPNREEPSGVNGQTCSDGVYTSVQLQAADLTDQQAVVARVETALDAAHAASVE